ncbi:MAG: hypothetical protein BGO01_20145 [Armatimonadetes bacterium 55-13]|nr:MAG: hypothetical protein BGO01_20145 [Armatimonadetes bacterium 55-13]
MINRIPHDQKKSHQRQMNSTIDSSIFSFTSLKRVLLGLVLLSLSAVGSAQIRFWAVTSSLRDVEMYRKLAEGFTAKTGIRVEVTPLAWGNFQTKYFTSMAAGLPPDVGVTNLGGPFDYGSVGGLVDLRGEFPEETKRIESRFHPGMLEMFSQGNKLYGIPSDISTLVLYYRTDVFERLGLKPPKTWSELNETIAKLEANGYRYYFGWVAGAQWALNLYTMPFDLPGFRRGADGKPEVLWNDPQYQRGVAEALQLWHLHDSPGKDLGNRIVGMFRSNDKDTAVPMFIDLHNLGGQIRQLAPELNGKWDIAPWPKADDGKAFHVMGGTTYVIFRQSRHKKEAIAWLDYLNSMEAQRFMVRNRESRGDESTFSISPLKEMYAPANDAFWQEPEMRADLPLKNVLAEMLPNFRTVQTIPGSVEAGRLESNLLDQMGTYLRDQMDALGQRYNVSRSELVKRLGNGTLRTEREKLERLLRAKLKNEYAKIQPQALKIMRESASKYEERYGDVVKRLPEYERQRNVLDAVKLLMGGLLALAVVAVIARPRLRRHWVSYLFVSVPILLAVVFVFVPALTALYLSFTDYHPVLPLSTAKWVGGENYSAAVHSGDLAATVGRTLRYAVYTLPVGILLALIFAYLLNGKLRGEKFWRFLFFSPLVTSVVSIALIFTQLFLGGKQGWLNALLLWAGAIRDPIPFLTSEHSFMNCVIVLAIWHGLAFTILVFLAGLQQIPASLFEAATMDGANPLRRFWNVAVPGLRPQLFFITVLGLIGAFQVFETIYILAGKSGDAGARFGPNDSALTMVPLIYHSGFETFEMGKSAAYAYILFVMILILTGIQFAVYRRKEATE